MKLSEQLKQDHESGDFGKALAGYSEQVEALEVEAARYRWLREWRSMEGLPYPTPPWVVRCELDPWPTTKACHGAALDAAIDEAMLKTPNDKAQGEAQALSRLSPGAAGWPAGKNEER